MTINLITQEEYDILLKIQKENPILTFQNKGYEYIDKSKFTEEDKKAFEQVENILKKCIKGFSKFFNFNFNKEEKLRVRFDYDWTCDEPNRSTSFTGVGYLFIDELLNGFIKKEEINYEQPI